MPHSTEDRNFSITVATKKDYYLLKILGDLEKMEVDPA